MPKGGWGTGIAKETPRGSTETPQDGIGGFSGIPGTSGGVGTLNGGCGIGIEIEGAETAGILHLLTASYL